MPKKTKKEKLLALYHKKIRLLESKQTTTPATVPTTPSPAPMPIIEQETKNVSINRYFFSDLKKSLILITLIIGLEISLYFVTMIK
ncbi:MAG: hypothetical protein Q7U68_02290 [Candidatus Roizmanbacteria bacterium]|nr:hypothetical protein [Candidatus Roizmanbacteria bacterium]